MQFEKDYYVNSSISNYKNYKDKKFDSLAENLIKELSLNENTSVLDFGAALGGLINSLKVKGIINVVGTDISYWAVQSGRELYDLSDKELQYYNLQLLENKYDYVFFLDVLEHISTNEINNILSLCNSKRVIVRIPVSREEGMNYFLEVSRNDKTHIQIHDKKWWKKLFEKNGYIFIDYIMSNSIFDSIGVFCAIFEKNLQKII